MHQFHPLPLFPNILLRHASLFCKQLFFAVIEAPVEIIQKIILLLVDILHRQRLGGGVLDVFCLDHPEHITVESRRFRFIGKVKLEDEWAERKQSTY